MTDATYTPPVCDGLTPHAAHDDCPGVAYPLPIADRTSAALAALHAAGVELGEALLEQQLETLGLVRSLEVLDAVRADRKTVADLEAILEAHAARLMPGPVWGLPGLFAKRQGGAKRKAWQHDAVRERVQHELAQRAGLDTTTGEVDEHVAHRVTEALEQVWKVTPAGDWKVTGLRNLGVRYDDLVETEYGRRTVQVFRGEVPPDE